MSNTAPAPTGTPTPKKSRRGLLIAVTIAIVLLGGGGAAYWVLAGGAKAHEAAQAHEEEEKEPETPGVAVALDPFVVNLADLGGSRFLRVSLSLIVHDEAHAAEIGESELVKMRVRSAVLELLAMQTADRLITPDGKAELKKAIAEAVGHAVEGLQVTDVLFSEFVVQF